MRTARLLLLFPAALLLSSCSSSDMDYFWNGPRDGSYTGGGYNNDNSDWQKFKAQAEWNQQAQAYKSGFTNTPPPGYWSR